LIRENEDEYSPHEFLVKFGKSTPITRMSDRKKILKQKIQQARKTLEDARKIIEDAEKELETLDIGGENAPQEENEEQEEEQEQEEQEEQEQEQEEEEENEEQDLKSSKKRKKRKRFSDDRSDDSDQDYEVGKPIFGKNFKIEKNFKFNIEKTDEEESFEENDTTPEE
jgi:hypothetical protein